MLDIAVLSLWFVFLLKTSQRLQMQCTLLIESQNVMLPSYLSCVIIPSATSYFETLKKKNDRSLKKNYTVTRLEVAFLMIVCCASCFERGSSLKAPCRQLATECIIRQVMYWLIHICSNVWNCVDPSKLHVEQLPSPERSIFLSSVCREAKNYYRLSWYVLFLGFWLKWTFSEWN